MFIVRPLSRDHLVVPFVSRDREQVVEAGVNEQPVIHFGFWILDFGLIDRTGLSISNRRQTYTGIGDDRTARLEKESDAVEDVDRGSVRRDVLNQLPSLVYSNRWLKVGRKHLQLLAGELSCL